MPSGATPCRRLRHREEQLLHRGVVCRGLAVALPAFASATLTSDFCVPSGSARFAPESP